jgi:ankyrin repeat protein
VIGGGGYIGSRAQDGRTALHVAAEKGHANCVRLLLDAGADTEAKNKFVRYRFAASAAGHVCVWYF